MATVPSAPDTSAWAKAKGWASVGHRVDVTWDKRTSCMRYNTLYYHIEKKKNQHFISSTINIYQIIYINKTGHGRWSKRPPMGSPPVAPQKPGRRTDPSVRWIRKPADGGGIGRTVSIGRTSGNAEGLSKDHGDRSFRISRGWLWSFFMPRKARCLANSW